jgi:drug/metabolite transporter (DMT)-like permease
VVTLRFSLAAGVLALLWRWLPGRSPRGRDLVLTGVMGVVVFCVGPRLQVLGVSLGKAGDSSVVIALEPLVTAVAAALFLREAIPAQRWVGFLLGLAGVVLLNGAWRLDFEVAGLLANLIFISSFLCESAYSVIGKPMLERVGLLKLLAASALWGAVLNLALDGPRLLRKAPDLTGVDWLVMGYLVLVCTLLGYTLWYVVIRETDVSLAALTILVQPMIGVFVAAWLLGEALHWGQLWGAVAIVLGLLVGLQRNGRTPLPDKEPAF